ncbi:MAG: FlgB family protein [Rhodobacteraceae bacterium]|nr:FlgB family protein [Paracoccaceae bacterium]
MFERPQVMAIASALAEHAAARQSAISRNVANADTPGYRAVDIMDFAAAYRTEAEISLRQTRPGHIPPSATGLANAAVETAPSGHLSPNGNSVSLESEMVKAAETRKDHDLALAVYRKSLDILRASIGRR